MRYISSMQDTFKYEDLPSVNTDFSRNTAGSYITLVDSGPYIQKNGDLTVSVQSEEIVPEPLQYRDLPAARDATRDEEIPTDPLNRYVRCTPDRRKTKLSEAVEDFSFNLNWGNNIRKGLAWTIHRGQSVIVYGFGEYGRPRTHLDRLFDSMIGRFSPVVRLFRSKEQNKRGREFLDKLTQAVDEAIGTRRREMFEVVHLVTMQAKRGHGYASTLVRMVTDMADQQGRATWLASSNVAVNTVFYNSLGFVTVKQFMLGDDNPTWEETPFPIAIMVREPQKAALSEKAN